MNLENDWNERKAIQLRMLQLQEDSQAIRAEYERLFNRLRELDSQEKTVSNFQENEKMNNIFSKDKEPQLELKMNKNDDDIFSRIEEIKRSISGQGSLSNINGQKQDASMVQEEVAATEINFSSKVLKKRVTAAEILNKPPSKEKSIYKDYLILSHLKLKRKLRNSEIKELLSEHSLNVKNTTVLLKNLMDKYSEITKAGHGIYQWREQ
ncbi:hypothetical protein H5P36_07385 [Bacillus sp. APMAM]|nr:hypothetical protein [Bacillus sp. APMAM]RTZ56545.1 hypothetical protein EKO25_07025 [Bacillus sp. SAJ1]